MRYAAFGSVRPCGQLRTSANDAVSRSLTGSGSEGGPWRRPGTAARGRHITDPATGRAVEPLASATVIGPELTWADVYATAAFVKGSKALGWLATLDRHLGILVGHDGTLSTVRGGPPAR